jgi:hypothetical protein
MGSIAHTHRVHPYLLPEHTFLFIPCFDKQLLNPCNVLGGKDAAVIQNNKQARHAWSLWHGEYNELINKIQSKFPTTALPRVRTKLLS